MHKQLRGFSIIEALAVVLIIGLSAMAFLSLIQGQNSFLKQSRQTNARDQLNNLFQGALKDRNLMYLSARHTQNKALRSCLVASGTGHQILPKATPAASPTPAAAGGGGEAAPAAAATPQPSLLSDVDTCRIGDVYPLWIIDVTDPTLKKVWSAPPNTPVKYDEHGQGCEEGGNKACRFEASTTFRALCDDESTKCLRPERIVISFFLKQIEGNQDQVPKRLKPTEYQYGHLLDSNVPPSFVSLPQSVSLSTRRANRTFDVSIQNPEPGQTVAWTKCESDVDNIAVQCGPFVSNKSTVQIFMQSTSAKAGKILLEARDSGRAPNTSVTAQVPFVFEKLCTLPWGVQIGENESLEAFEEGVVDLSKTCKAESRVCKDGVLSGSFKFQSCIVRTPSACQAPWGEAVAHGGSIIGFQNPVVPFGQTCLQETRLCTDGSLSGNYAHKTCVVQDAAPCPSPTGGTVPHGGSVQVYQQASVAFGQTCASEQRLCQNGVLSGTFTAPSCQVSPPRNCTLPWGGSVNHGAQVTAYRQPSVPFGSFCDQPGNFETRNCVDGNLTGNFGSPSCMVMPP